MADNMTGNATIVHAEDTIPVFSRVSWGAIFAGVAIAFVVYFLLALLGTAIGLTVRDNTTTNNLGTMAAVWAIVSLCISLLAGGYVTSQCIAGENRTEGMIHGVLVWAVMFGVMVYLAGTTVSMGFSALIGMAQAVPVQTNATNWQELAKRAGVPQERINEWQQQGQQAQGQQEQQGQQGQRAGQDQGGDRPTQVAWWTLAGALVSIGAAALGGLMGAGNSPQFLGVPRTRVTHHEHHEVRTGL